MRRYETTKANTSWAISWCDEALTAPSGEHVAPRAAVAGVSNLRAGFLCKEDNSLSELMVIVVVKNFGGTADPIIQVLGWKIKGKLHVFIQVYLSPYVLEVLAHF
jgi:hypothetical protein